MSTQPSGRQAGLRSAISAFLTERLNAKLEKLADDDPKRSELHAQFVPATWLGDAARRVAQIQAVTHSLKPIHPDAKGSSLFCAPPSLMSLQELGTHALGKTFDADVVGNAAALDVYKFLKVEHEGRTISSLCLEADADLGAALSHDASVAIGWMAAFSRLAEPRGDFSSHTQAKQIYWPVGADPHDNAGYHLLAPLYPTSLVHRFYQVLQDDRFGEDAKAARDARKAGTWHERPVREYPHLAVQKLGGTKPQNISQLNSERRGDNYLLASLPPAWKSPAVKPVLGVASLFDVFRWRPNVRTLTGHLRHFLQGDPARNKHTRERRDELVESVLDELIQFIADVQSLAPGWSADAMCELPRHQIALLDAADEERETSELIDRLAGDFANWLNAQLRDPLPTGDAEYAHWCAQAREVFKQAQREGTYEW
jgi:CRISPR-associated protein Csy1